MKKTMITEDVKDVQTNNKKKSKWPEFKERIVNALQFMIFAVAMLMGLWLIYVFIWNALDFPMNNTAFIVLLVQAVISELLYFKWVQSK